MEEDGAQNTHKRFGSEDPIIEDVDVPKETPQDEPLTSVNHDGAVDMEDEAPEVMDSRPAGMVVKSQAPAVQVSKRKLRSRAKSSVSRVSENGDEGIDTSPKEGLNPKLQNIHTYDGDHMFTTTGNSQRHDPTTEVSHPEEAKN